MLITLLPPSRMRMIDAAQAAAANGSRLWTDGRTLVSAPRAPGPDWHRVGVRIIERRAA